MQLIASKHWRHTRFNAYAWKYIQIRERSTTQQLEWVVELVIRLNISGTCNCWYRLQQGVYTTVNNSKSQLLQMNCVMLRVTTKVLQTMVDAQKRLKRLVVVNVKCWIIKNRRSSEFGTSFQREVPQFFSRHPNSFINTLQNKPRVASVPKTCWSIQLFQYKLVRQILGHRIYHTIHMCWICIAW